MIEIKYWKNDLKILAKELKLKPLRISNKTLRTMEKRIVLCFLIIRKLLEAKTKLTQSIYDFKTIIHYYQVNHDSYITKLNNVFFEKHYNMDNPKSKAVGIRFICNKLIHSEILFLLRDQNLHYSQILVCSEFEQKKALYDISIKTIIEILLLIDNDQQKSLVYTFDKSIDDFIIYST
ncbi:hypothetical protein [Leptospira alstonii]|uniref:hypothetical protein n=1 Tax=Leptospira alstonii TaxID=28452 RepID=UPI0005605B2C|nr:hypothetical protein [Leptospira alstonii]